MIRSSTLPLRVPSRSQLPVWTSHASSSCVTTIGMPSRDRRGIILKTTQEEAASTSHAGQNGSTVTQPASSPAPDSTKRSPSPRASDFDQSPVPEALSRGASAVAVGDGREATDTPSPAPEPEVAVAQAASELSPSPSPQAIQVESHAVHFDASEGEQKGEDFFASKELIDELKEGFGSRGEAWFVLQMVLAALLVVCPFKLQGLIDMLGTLSLTTGVVSMLYGLFSLGRSLSPMPHPRKQHALVTGGMFAYVRHPMYGGLLMAALGLVCLTRSETRLALTLLLWWILEQKVQLEENLLQQRYPQYAAYKASVKKFVPFLY